MLFYVGVLSSISFIRNDMGNWFLIKNKSLVSCIAGDMNREKIEREEIRMPESYKFY